MIPWAEVPSGGHQTAFAAHLRHPGGLHRRRQDLCESGIAERWEEAADKLSWTFWLRQGVLFHDGTELTAEDVQFSIDSLFDPKAVAPLLGPVEGSV